MKTFIYFILTLCISCGCLIAATNTKAPFFLFGAAFAIWVLFFWCWHRRLKREAMQRSREQQFRDYQRTHYQRK
ncbi:MAG: hypothetical protein ACXVJB_00175 [Mucilaginibacter sp.]